MKVKVFISMMCAVLFNAITGSAIAAATGLSPLTGAVGMNVIAAVFGGPQGGVLREGVYTEIWTGEMVKALRGRLEATWLDGIPDNSSIAENDAIHLVDVGVDPDVLINNTDYPIPTQSLPDKDITISLDKFQTKVTPITDDELYGCSYDKMKRVKDSHANSITDAKFKKAAFNLCAKSNSATTPVLSTSGTKDVDTGRHEMTVKDMLAMKAALDNLGVPEKNRRLVLCTDHVNDLLGTDQNFKEQYNINRNDGKIGHLYGFDIYEFANTPIYASAGTKKALTEVASKGEFHCSFAFYTNRVFKATGSTKMYWRDAKTDPEKQQNTVNFRHYFICMPKKADAGVVMMSKYTA